MLALEVRVLEIWDGDAGVVGVFEGIGWSGNADVVVC